MTKYRTVNVTTLKGLQTAERLHANGWKMNRPGMFSIQFYKVASVKGESK